MEKKMKDISLGRIGQIAVNVHDLEQATAFYRDKLGMKLLFSAPPKMAFFDANGVRLMLGIPERPEFDHPSSIIYFQVEDIDAAYDSLTNRGVLFATTPALIAPMETYDLWLAEFRDSEGNVMALMCEKAKA
jgi:predicted enzyme related to lactoylglutathione lyase